MLWLWQGPETGEHWLRPETDSAAAPVTGLCSLEPPRLGHSTITAFTGGEGNTMMGAEFYYLLNCHSRATHWRLSAYLRIKTVADVVRHIHSLLWQSAGNWDEETFPLFSSLGSRRSVPGYNKLHAVITMWAVSPPHGDISTWSVERREVSTYPGQVTRNCIA